MSEYLQQLELARTNKELDRIVNRAANDESISNAEYEFIYSTAVEIARR